MNPTRPLFTGPPGAQGIQWLAVLLTVTDCSRSVRGAGDGDRQEADTSLLGALRWPRFQPPSREAKVGFRASCRLICGAKVGIRLRTLALDWEATPEG